MNVQRFYYGMILLLVFIGLALQASLLLWIGGLLTLPMLVYSFFRSNRLFQGMGLAFLSGGALFVPFSNVSLQDIPPLFSNNLTLLFLWRLCLLCKRQLKPFITISKYRHGYLKGQLQMGNYIHVLS